MSERVKKYEREIYFIDIFDCDCVIDIFDCDSFLRVKGFKNMKGKFTL